MKEITIPILWSVIQEMFGALLWLAPVALVAILALYLAALRRPGATLASGRWPAIVTGVIAGIVFAALAPAATQSSWAYVAGATDYVLILGGALAAAIAAALIMLPVFALARRA